MRTDDPPSCVALFGRDELVVEPVLLSTTHHGSTRVVGYLIDVVRVPAWASLARVCNLNWEPSETRHGIEHSSICSVRGMPLPIVVKRKDGLIG